MNSPILLNSFLILADDGCYAPEVVLYLCQDLSCSKLAFRFSHPDSGSNTPKIPFLAQMVNLGNS